MKYIVCKKFEGLAICGNVKIAKDTLLDVTESGFITLNEQPICAKTSQRAYDYFASNDDGNGKVRFNLTHTIVSNVGRIIGEAQAAANALISNLGEGEEPNAEALDACYAKANALTAYIKENHPQFVRPNGSWSFAFYNGGIAELQALDAHVKEVL